MKFGYHLALPSIIGKGAGGLGLLVLALLAPATRAHEVGINTAYAPNIREETMRRWAVGTGANTARVGMRMDLSQRHPGHADNWVRDFSGQGRWTLGFLFNKSAPHKLTADQTEWGIRPPGGLWDPIFDNDSDSAAPGAALNPKNEWAVFVARMVERYDADGQDDAPGSPRVTYFSVWNEPDWMPWPHRPDTAFSRTMKNWWGQNFHDLARLVFISHRVARWANPNSKVGLQLCFPESLGFLLDDHTHPLARNCDFVDFHAYAGPGADDNVFRGDGLLPILRAMQAQYTKRNLPLPAFLCTETGLSGGVSGTPSGRAQAAAAIKVNVAGAAAGLIMTCWYALTDPSWKDMGLIADVSQLPGDGAGATLKDAYDALRTVALLLKPDVKFVEEIAVGSGAHAYRFRNAAGHHLIVAWADDKAGPDATATVALPLKPGTWKRMRWDFARTGQPDGAVTATAGATRLTLDTMPIFLQAED